MALTETFEIDKADLERLERLGDRMAATLPLMRAIGGHLRDAARARFRTNVAPDGAAWKPSLRVMLGGGRTLRQSGILRDSFHDSATATEARVESEDNRAAIHHFGGIIRAKGAGALRFGLPGGGFATVRSVTMPARPALGVSAEDREAISGLIQDFIDMAAGESGADPSGAPA